MNNSYRTGIRIGIGTAMILGLVALTNVRAAETSDSEEVSALLNEAKSQAYQLSLDASTMETYSRSNADWQTRAVTLNQMKDRINASGKTLAKLDEARKLASPWQATAIDRIRPLLKEIASYTEIVIGYVNQNPKRLFMREFKDHIEANADACAQLSRLIADFVDYGHTKNRLENLTAKLELPSK